MRNFLRGVFWEEFFGKNVLGEILWEDFFGRNFFGRNSLGGIQSAKLSKYGKNGFFLSRFFLNVEGRKKFRSLEVRSKLIALKK